MWARCGHGDPHQDAYEPRYEQVLSSPHHYPGPFIVELQSQLFYRARAELIADWFQAYRGNHLLFLQGRKRVNQLGVTHVKLFLQLAASEKPRNRTENMFLSKD